MSCIAAKPLSPLELYARALPDDADVAPLHFPMYTVSVERLLKMTAVEPHEKLKASGELVVFHSDGGKKAAFVSHQWIAKEHPDPNFKQMAVLQAALRRLLGGKGFVRLDPITETFVATAKPFPLKDLQNHEWFIWYDYFSCPQLENRKYTTDLEDGSQQATAINSIPAYIARCHLFLALCPVLDCPEESKVLTSGTWSRRGWCRVERAAWELSPNSTWILIQSESSIEAVGTVASFVCGSVGEGEFTIAADRHLLGPVMQQIILRKLMHCLRLGDLPAFRRYFNLQGVHLRGLEIEPLGGLLPSSSEGAADEALVEFLHQNGFRRVDEKDSAGWRPLHYAAIAGNTKVLRQMLERKVDVNQLTSKDEPQLGFPLWMSALSFAVFYKQHDTIQLLLDAKALLKSRTFQSIDSVSSDSAECVRLLCAAGSHPLSKNLLGFTALQTAAAFAATMSVQEMVASHQLSPLALSQALFHAAAFHGGTAELIQHLMELRADPDFQFGRNDLRPVGRLFYAAKSMQHSLGRDTALSAFAYHLQGSTPLMQAIRSTQYEAAATLIAAGARLDLRNCRKWQAADFARGQAIPDFLKQGLDGDTSECQRVSSLALAGSYVKVPL